MSDYVKAKVIRLPFPKTVLDACNTTDCWECEKYLEEKFGEHRNKFEIECTDSAYYLDYVLESSYGEWSGEFGFAFYLNSEEIKKYRPLFELVTTDFKDEDLRKVVYCYYNCCECPDYYKVSEDIFDKL